jgi:hypothetical protein
LLTCRFVRRTTALFFAAIAGVATGCVWACLPNLEITQPSQPAPYCGDGVIDPDAGEECDPGPDASSVLLQACPRCTVPCDGGTFPFKDPASNHCYFGLNNTSDIDEAGASCEANGGHVVRFVSQDEVLLVASGSPYSVLWVGLREVKTSGSYVPSEPTSEPGWSPVCGGCFAQVEDGGIPRGATANEIGECIIAGQDASAAWTQSICAKASNFARQTLCEREPVGTRTTPCPYGACFTVAATTASKHYVLIGSRQTAGSAFSMCQTLGGQVAVFQSREEREQVGYEIARQTAIDGGANDYWIGLGTDGGVWVWDGPNGGLEPLPWAENQPSASDAGLRAYAIVQPGIVSSELAYAEATPQELHFPLCQY